jgi:imidazolonepropionase-like amidohydrolase
MNAEGNRRNPRLAVWAWIGLILLAAPSTGEEMAGVRTIRVDRGAVDPCVSPDGTTIAAAVYGRICLFPMAGGEARVLSDGLGWDGHPAWSPDGLFIACARRLPGGCDLVQTNLATGGADVLFHAEHQIGRIRYAPNQESLFFVLQRNQYDAHIWKIPSGGGTPEQVTRTDMWHEWTFAFSPDGSEMLLDSGRYGPSNLYRLEIEGLKAVRLTWTPAHQSQVEWSRDGSVRLYLERVDGLERVMMMTGEAGTPVCVHSGPYEDRQLALSPDGSAAVISAGRRLYRLSLPSGELAPVPFAVAFRGNSPANPDLVITNARLWRGAGRGILENASIEIRGGRIAAIKASGDGPLRSGAVPVLDAKGRMVLPGLMDSHSHIWDPFEGDPMLDQGVTSVREVGSPLASIKNFQEAFDLGLLSGPRVFTTGPLIDGMNGYHPLVHVELGRAESAASLVRSLKAQGVDALKVYFMLEPEVLSAVVAEARRLGVPILGHIGVRTGWTKAMEAGISGLCHIRLWKDLLPPDRQPQGEDGNLGSDRDLFMRIQADWTDIDPEGEAVGRIIRMMAERKVGFDPTLAIQRVGDDLRKVYSLEQYATAREGYRRMGRFVRRCWESGVPILAGTDGVLLADEMEALADAGIPNEAVIQAATENGARWLGKQDDFGTIEPGRRADLILVDGDPLKDIREIRKIVCVVKDGRIVRKTAS